MTVRHKFVEFVPDVLEDNVVYISIEYCTAVHKCICGCGNEVVTPLSPTDWQLTFNGKAISLYPSIGNWNFQCKSHYWITNNKIRHSPIWSKDQIENGGKEDKKKKRLFFQKRKNKR